MEEPTPDGNAPYLSEEEIAKITHVLELEYIETRDGFLLLENPTRSAGRFRRDANGIPLKVAREILKAIKEGAECLEAHEGWIDPKSGLVEFNIRQDGINGFRHSLIERYKFETRPCIHLHEVDPPFEFNRELDSVSPVIRVTSKDGSTCIEISRNTPLCTPILPMGRHERRVGTDTLKIFLPQGRKKEDLAIEAQQLANSFLFELNARHRAFYTLRPRKDPSRYLPKLPTPSQSVRFPRTTISDNIANLFSIPGNAQMRRNPTIGFLSYYQTIESHLPAIHKRETLANIRRIIRSLDFDEENDPSIMKILTSVERAHGVSEGEQLKLAIEHCVPTDKLHEFFSLNLPHFGKSGPISGIPHINLKNGESLASQTAKRVYALRNRIVHAKDDARFIESKVLLPTSREASLLQPDIELVRLLAIEVIVDNS